MPAPEEEEPPSESLGAMHKLCHLLPMLADYASRHVLAHLLAGESEASIARQLGLLEAS